MDDISSNHAPKAQAQYDREKQLQDQKDSMVPPEPEVDTEITPVPRSEMMSEIPKEGPVGVKRE